VAAATNRKVDKGILLLSGKNVQKYNAHTFIHFFFFIPPTRKKSWEGRVPVAGTTIIYWTLHL